MKIFNFVFFKKNNKLERNETQNINLDQYCEIGKLVKEARIQNNLSIKELSVVSKIPESSLKAIENNIKDLIPKRPFIGSILLKLEKCLFLEKNSLVGLDNKEANTFKKGKNHYIIRKVNFMNSWEGIILYFLFLTLIIFILNRYFISSTSIIEIQLIEEKLIKK